MQQNTRLPYSDAQIELITFANADIITTSDPNGGGDQTQGNPDGWTGEW